MRRNHLVGRASRIHPSARTLSRTEIEESCRKDLHLARPKKNRGTGSCSERRDTTECVLAIGAPYTRPVVRGTFGRHAGRVPLTVTLRSRNRIVNGPEMLGDLGRYSNTEFT